MIAACAEVLDVRFGVRAYTHTRTHIHRKHMKGKLKYTQVYLLEASIWL